MKRLTQAQSGAIWNSLGSTMYAANSFLMLALVGRVGTVEQTGSFGIAFTVAQLLYIVGLFGVSHFQMTDYNRRYSFREYLRVRILSCVLMLACCGVVCAVLQFTGVKLAYTVLLTIFMMLNVIGDLYQSLFFQHNRLDLSGSALFFRTLWPLLAFGLCLVLTERMLLSLLVLIGCNLLVTLHYIRGVAPPFLSQDTSPNPQGIRGLLRECLPLFVGLVLMNFVINSSKYAIEYLMDDTAQGYYNMIFLPAFVISLCSQFLFRPLLNRYAQLLEQRDYRGFRRQLLMQLSLVGALTALCCGGAAVLGVPVLSLVFNKDLSAYLIPLLLIVLGGGIYATCDLLYYIYVIIRQKQVIFCLYFTAAILAFPITFSLVHTWGITGAAISFFVMHLLMLCTYLIHLVFWVKSQPRGEQS